VRHAASFEKRRKFEYPMVAEEICFENTGAQFDIGDVEIVVDETARPITTQCFLIVEQAVVTT